MDNQLLRKSTDSDTKPLRKVAIEVNREPYLKELDVSMNLNDILKSICTEKGINFEFEKYSLKIKDVNRKITETAYVTEFNKENIKNGAVLKLCKSPRRKIHDLSKKLYKNDLTLNADSLCKMADASKDFLILKELNYQGVVKKITNIAEQKDTGIEIHGNCLTILERCLLKRFFDTLPLNLTNRMMEMIHSNQPKYSDVILLCLRILTILMKNKTLKYSSKFPQSLLPYVGHDKTKIQESALELLNCLFLYPNDERERKAIYDYMSKPETILKIYKGVFGKPLSKKLKHQLYVYQIIILRKYTKSLRTMMTENEDLLQNIAKASADQFQEIIECPESSITKADDDCGHARELYDRQKSFSRSMQSLNDIFSNMKTTIRAKRRARTVSIGSQASISNDEERKYFEPRNRSSSMDKIYPKHPTFKTYVTDSDATVGLFKEMPLTFEFYGKFNKDSLRLQNMRNEFGIKGDLDINRMSIYENSSKKKQWDMPGKLIMNSDSPEFSSPKTRKIRSKNQFGRNRVSELAYTNVLYFAKHQNEAFNKLLVILKNGPKSVLYLGDDITRMLCEILQIGKRFRIEENSEDFHPLCFRYFDRFLEELFCVTMKLFDKTRKEMKVTVDSVDYPQVLDAVKEQIILALLTKPKEFSELDDALQKIPYDVIVKKRELDIANQIKWEMSHKPVFLELRELLKPDVVAMIKKQRLLFMKSGEHVPRINSRGQKSKDHRLFIWLNKSHSILQVDDCPEKLLECKHILDRQIYISDIEEIQIGEKSNLFKNISFQLLTERDMFFRPGTKQPNRHDKDKSEKVNAVSIKKKDDTFVDFCASSDRTMNFWADGVNLLIGKPMESASMAEDLENLLDFEVMTRFAEVEGLELPDKPPVIPPLPPNYNFSA